MVLIYGHAVLKGDIRNTGIFADNYQLPSFLMKKKPDFTIFFQLHAAVYSIFQNIGKNGYHVKIRNPGRIS